MHSTSIIDQSEQTNESCIELYYRYAQEIYCSITFTVIMQFFRCYPKIRTSFRCVSTFIVNTNSSTIENELNQINQLMQNYNDTHVPIRTYALFQWMIHVINIQPNFASYLHIIHACNLLKNNNACRTIHHWINKDTKLSPSAYRQLRIKLIYMYARTEQIQLAEELFQQAKDDKHSSIDALLFGTIFKGELNIVHLSNNKLNMIFESNKQCRFRFNVDAHHNLWRVFHVDVHEIFLS
jgi:hypothetical protein